MPVLNPELLDHATSFRPISLFLTEGGKFNGFGYTLYKTNEDDAYYFCGMLAVACHTTAQVSTHIRRDQTNFNLEFVNPTGIGFEGHSTYSQTVDEFGQVLVAQTVGAQGVFGSHGWCVGKLSLNQGGVRFNIDQPIPSDGTGHMENTNVVYATIAGSALHDATNLHYFEPSGLELFGNNLAAEWGVSPHVWYLHDYDYTNESPEITSSIQIGDWPTEFVIRPTCRGN